MKERIKKIRKSLGLTQQQFADALGLKRNTIAQYETGRNEPIGAIAKLICKEYDINENWLYTGKGCMYSHETINSRIKKVRENLGISQEKFAKELNLSKNFIWMIEKEQRVPSKRTIVDILTKFNVNETWLRTGQGSIYTNKTRNTELEDFFEDVLNDEPSSFRVRFATVLSRLSTEQWDLIADIVNKLVEECSKENSHDE